MTTEAVHDSLWPDLPASRQRLNTVVHRLRRVLGDACEAIVRSRSTIGVDERRFDVDLWRFRARSKGTNAERLEAVLAVRGNLGHLDLSGLPALDMMRAVVAETWLATARSLVDHGHVTATELEPAAISLGVATSRLDFQRP